VFPLAFFSGAFVFDLIGYFGERYALHALAFYLCVGGASMAALAAVPGIIDYLKVIPPNSSAKKRGTIHALINVTVLLIFVVVIFIRREEFGPLLLLAEGVAVTLMLTSAWLGATLVHRNQIGVDHRYASAGKWKEAWIKKEDLPIEVAQSDELKENQMMLLHIAGKRLVLARTENGYAVFDDRCPHRGGSLADGVVMGGQVHCPWHGSQYDVKSGACLKGPSTVGVQVYQVKEQNGKVLLLNLK
jgi:nitrite reductase/ring-hydroxylating ferredoxin subunit/uncharacterized membrane protein